MDKREALKSMLNNLINDKQEEAQLDLHSYLTAKMKDVSGLSTPEMAASADETSAVEVADGVDDESTAEAGESGDVNV